MPMALPAGLKGAERALNWVVDGAVGGEEEQLRTGSLDHRSQRHPVRVVDLAVVEDKDRVVLGVGPQVRDDHVLALSE